MLRHAVRLNSLSELAITKLDVLDTLDTVKVCVAYEVDGERHEHLPVPPVGPAQGTPIYEELPGWTTDLSDGHRAPRPPADGAATTSPSSRSRSACPIRLVGVGPGRDQFVHRTP